MHEILNTGMLYDVLLVSCFEAKGGSGKLNYWLCWTFLWGREREGCVCIHVCMHVCDGFELKHFLRTCLLNLILLFIFYLVSIPSPLLYGTVDCTYMSRSSLRSLLLVLLYPWWQSLGCMNTCNKGWGICWNHRVCFSFCPSVPLSAWTLFRFLLNLWTICRHTCCDDATSSARMSCKKKIEEKKGCYLQGQCHSEGLYNQNMTVSAVSSGLMFLVQGHIGGSKRHCIFVNPICFVPLTSFQPKKNNRTRFVDALLPITRPSTEWITVAYSLYAHNLVTLPCRGDKPF